MLRLSDFGACADGNSLDDGPMAAALAAWSAQGGDLVIEGDVALGSPHQVSVLKASRLIGGGTLHFKNPTSGLYASVTANVRFAIEGLAFLTYQLDAGVGLRVTMPLCPYPMQQGPLFRDLSLRGADPAQHRWSTSFRLERAWKADVDGLDVKGRDTVAMPTGGDCAVELFDCMAATVRRLHALHVEHGLRTTGSRIEGLNLLGGELVGVRKGVVLPALAWITAGTRIDGMHINAYERCIEAANVAQIDITGGLYYKCNLSTDRYWRGVDIATCDMISVRGAKFLTPGVPPSSIPANNDAVVLTAAQNCRVEGNQVGPFPNVGCVAVLGGAANNNVAANNTRIGGNVLAPVSFATGSGNVWG